MAYVKKTSNPNMGRPSAAPRTSTLVVRLSESENKLLCALTEKTGMTKTEIVVSGIKKLADELNIAE